MEDNRQDKDLKQAELNKEAEETTSRVTRHTWIGDKDEVRPDLAARPVTRKTFSDAGDRGTRMVTTRIVEREKKPYRGFITDEEISRAEAAAEIDRRAIAESRAAREALMQTRVYGVIPEQEEEEKPEEKAPEPKPRRKRTVNIQITDNKKFRRLIVLLAVFVVLLAFEISFALMKARTAALPDSTARLRSKTATLQANNTELQESIDKIGDYDEVKANRDSWKKIRDQLAE
jgi:cell division protein FtsL